MRKVEEDDELDLLILLGDQHGSPVFGGTIDEVRRAFPGSELELIEMGAGRGDTPLVRAENLGACLVEAARVLARRRPDIVLVHGDRGEHLMVAYAALTLGIPVAHTQGGDRSGNVDELQRHAISKLAHLHFPESEAAAERLRRMGEDDWRIYVVGSTYVDRLVAGLYVAPNVARAAVDLGSEEPFVLVLVHPETFLSSDENGRIARTVLEAVRETGLRAVATYPCSDPGYDAVLAELRRAEEWGLVLRPNIDNDVYLGLMAQAEVLVGNSSSALVEAPYLRLPAVNVGDRQHGRERDGNVIDAEPVPGAVTAAIAEARNPEFRAGLTPSSRLGDGHAAERIIEVLRTVPLDDRLLRKQLAY
jgi:GDP/UDP-N,N'-diacetylbacillosamine 2-epimerase (hydrolysing)